MNAFKYIDEFLWCISPLSRLANRFLDRVGIEIGVAGRTSNLLVFVMFTISIRIYLCMLL